MNKTDQYFKALTVLVRDAPRDELLTKIWIKVSMENALRFAVHLQKGKKDKRDPRIIAHDATASLWINIFIKKHQIRKSLIAMLFYRVRHFDGYRTKKDDESSLTKEVEAWEKQGKHEDMQSVQEDDTGRYVLRGTQGNRGTGTRPGSRPSCRPLSGEARGTIQERGMASLIAGDTQSPPDL